MVKKDSSDCDVGDVGFGRDNVAKWSTNIETAKGGVATEFCRDEADKTNPLFDQSAVCDLSFDDDGDGIFDVGGAEDKGGEEKTGVIERFDKK